MAGEGSESAPAAAAPPRPAAMSRAQRRQRLICARIPAKRRGLLLRTYCLLRGVFFDSEVLTNLKAEAILAVFIAFGLAAWYFDRRVNDLKEEQALRLSEFNEQSQLRLAEHRERAEFRLQHQLARHEKREEAMTRFADGIPKNASYLRSIALAGLTISHARSSAAATTPGGSDAAGAAAAAAAAEEQRRRQMVLDRTAELQDWRKSCPHYASLCEEIVGRFDAERRPERPAKDAAAASAAAARRDCLRDSVLAIKDAFNALNALSLGTEEIDTAINCINDSVADIEQKLAQWGQAAGNADPSRAAQPAAAAAVTEPATPAASQPAAGVWRIEGVRVDDVLTQLRALRRQPVAPGASEEVRLGIARRTANDLTAAIDQFQVLSLRIMHVELAELPELP